MFQGFSPGNSQASIFEQFTLNQQNLLLEATMLMKESGTVGIRPGTGPAEDRTPLPVEDAGKASEQEKVSSDRGNYDWENFFFKPW
ncbi:MAG TPA: hypothetical protein VJK25_00650 [Patescibacteria group bacterium]|nr:hypothetical protein [Patescibacteria group bacterium]